MKEKLLAKNKIFIKIFEFFMIAVGAVIAAFAIEEFLVPCTILDGGIVGISIMLNKLTGVRLGLLIFVINIPFLLVGMRKIGYVFIIKSAYAMAIFSVALELFAHFLNAKYDYLLAVCFGGLILGVGVGLVIKFGGCLDGTETVAILLNRKWGLSVGRTILVFNILIFSAAAFLLGVDRALYSLLTYFIASKVLDMVESGWDDAKATMIITNDATEVSRKIYEKLGRTVTIMEGEGLVSGKKVVLYCVVTKFELHELKNIINSIDESAFVTVSDVSEIIGEHVKKKSPKENKSDDKNQDVI